MIRNDGMGQGSLTSVVGELVKPIVEAMTPQLKKAAMEASEAAKPAVKEIVREEVIPKVGLALVLGLVAVGVLGAAIGSHYAAKPIRRYRTNVSSMRLRRRRAA